MTTMKTITTGQRAMSEVRDQVSVKSMGGMKPKVLIVEDETAVVTLLRYNLEYQGFEVDAVSDGEEALVALEDNPPAIVLVDWILPQLSVLDVYRS